MLRQSWRNFSKSLGKPGKVGKTLETGSVTQSDLGNTTSITIDNWEDLKSEIAEWKNQFPIQRSSNHSEIKEKSEHFKNEQNINPTLLIEPGQDLLSEMVTAQTFSTPFDDLIGSFGNLNFNNSNPNRNSNSSKSMFAREKMNPKFKMKRFISLKENRADKLEPTEKPIPKKKVGEQDGPLVKPLNNISQKEKCMVPQNSPNAMNKFHPKNNNNNKSKINKKSKKEIKKEKPKVENCNKLNNSEIKKEKTEGENVLSKLNNNASAKRNKMASPVKPKKGVSLKKPTISSIRSSSANDVSSISEMSTSKKDRLEIKRKSKGSPRVKSPQRPNTPKAKSPRSPRGKSPRSPRGKSPRSPALKRGKANLKKTGDKNKGVLTHEPKKILSNRQKHIDDIRSQIRKELLYMLANHSDTLTEQEFQTLMADFLQNSISIDATCLEDARTKIRHQLLKTLVRESRGLQRHELNFLIEDALRNEEEKQVIAQKVEEKKHALKLVTCPTSNYQEYYIGPEADSLIVQSLNANIRQMSADIIMISDCIDKTVTTSLKHILGDDINIKKDCQNRQTSTTFCDACLSPVISLRSKTPVSEKRCQSCEEKARKMFTIECYKCGCTREIPQFKYNIVYNKNESEIKIIRAARTHMDKAITVDIVIRTQHMMQPECSEWGNYPEVACNVQRGRPDKQLNHTYATGKKNHYPICCSPTLMGQSRTEPWSNLTIFKSPLPNKMKSFFNVEIITIPPAGPQTKQIMVFDGETFQLVQSNANNDDLSEYDDYMSKNQQNSELNDDVMNNQNFSCDENFNLSFSSPSPKRYDPSKYSTQNSPNIFENNRLLDNRNDLFGSIINGKSCGSPNARTGDSPLIRSSEQPLNIFSSAFLLKGMMPFEKGKGDHD